MLRKNRVFRCGFKDANLVAAAHLYSRLWNGCVINGFDMPMEMVAQRHQGDMWPRSSLSYKLKAMLYNDASRPEMGQNRGPKSPCSADVQRTIETR